MDTDKAKINLTNDKTLLIGYWIILLNDTEHIMPITWGKYS